MRTCLQIYLAAEEVIDPTRVNHDQNGPDGKPGQADLEREVGGVGVVDGEAAFGVRIGREEVRIESNGGRDEECEDYSGGCNPGEEIVVSRPEAPLQSDEHDGGQRHDQPD